MEKVEKFFRQRGELIETYKFDKFFSENDFEEIIRLIEGYNVKITGIRISNSLDQPEHFYRSFDSLDAFRRYVKDDYYIDDFGVQCAYNDMRFALTFDFSKKMLVTFKYSNINLDNLLEDLEGLTKKKVK